MAIVPYNKHMLPETTRKVNTTDNANVYLTEDKTLLKKYKLNLMYLKLIAKHDNNFKDYLLELSMLDNDLLNVPTNIYVHGTKAVLAQEIDNPYGTSIDELYPKTNLNNLFKAFVKMDHNIDRVDYLLLQNINPSDIVYDGENITLMDLDNSTFDDVDVDYNRGTVNRAIAHSLIDVNDITKMFKKYPSLKTSYMDMAYGYRSLYKFLAEYKAAVEAYKEHQCTYLRDLSLERRRVVK